jgi:uracil phosphoribosyltransferase
VGGVFEPGFDVLFPNGLPVVPPGATMESVLYILKQWGVKKIKVMSLIATKHGAAAVFLKYLSFVDVVCRSVEQGRKVEP